MANIIQRRRGTTAQHVSFVGAEGEITIDLSKFSVVVHDGTTPAGYPLAREDMSNVINHVGITQLNLSDGSSGQVLKTDGAGGISFTSAPDISGASVGGDVTGTVGNIQIGEGTITLTELGFSDGTAGQVLSTDGAGTLSFINQGDPTTASIGGDLSGTVANAQLKENVVTGTELVDDSVSTSHIVDVNVTAAKLATDAVETNKIKDLNVTDAKILSVMATKLTGAMPAIDGFQLINLNPATHSHVGVNPYDISFIAGYDASTLPIDIVAQTYGEMIMARTGTFEGEVGVIDNAGVGSAIEVDVLKNNVSIYSAKPTFPDGQVTAQSGTLSTTTFASGDKVSFKVTQIGSGTAGSGLRFMLKCKV